MDVVECCLEMVCGKWRSMSKPRREMSESPLHMSILSRIRRAFNECFVSSPADPVHPYFTLDHLTTTTRNKKLPGAPGIATRSKDATRGSWPYY